MSQYRVIDMGNVIEVYKYSNLNIEKRILSEETKAWNKAIEEKWKNDADDQWITFEGLEEWVHNPNLNWENIGELTLPESNKEKTSQWDRSLEYRKTVSHRRRETIRRYANMNFKKDSHFVTLTYAENMKDVTQGNKDFKDFIKRLKRAKYTTKVKIEGKTRYIEETPLKYLSVAEFQDRGAVHYHVLINLIGFDLSSNEAIRQSERDLAEIWGHGFVDIQKIQHVDNVGAYLIKYLQKGFMDDRTKNTVMYLTSRNLIKPKLIGGDHAVMIAESLLGCIPNYTNGYSSFYHGDITYKEYNLERLGIER